MKFSGLKFPNIFRTSHPTVEMIPFLLITIATGMELNASIPESDLRVSLKSVPLNSVPHSLIEEIVTKQYFEAASELIRRAHVEGVDVSVPIRNAVSQTRSKLDMLVKLLDPEFSRPQKVPPAFQWTQNDSAIFIQLKYSRRFNAPGAVDVDDFNCTFGNSSLLFSAIGGHSGKRFEYALNLDFFDLINPERSSWNIGSVGKVLLTISKLSVSKWPRLLVSNQKIDNMHYWYDFGDQMESSMKALPTIYDSRLTCQSQGSLFCPTSGKCTGSCSECRSKPLMLEGGCVGPPAYTPKDLSFTDTDGDFGFVSGDLEVTVTKEYHRYDIDGFNIYLQPSGENLSSDSAPLATSGSIVNTTAKLNIPRTALASSIQSFEWIAVPFNRFGENREKSLKRILTDVFRPENCSTVEPVSFDDFEPDEGSLKGVFRFKVPSSTNSATHLVLHWGKSDSAKLTGALSHIADVSVHSGVYNLSTTTAIPPGASHVLVFAKSGAGEGSSPVGVWAIEDRQRPRGLVSNLRLLSDRRIEFKRIADESLITGYVVRSEWTGSAPQSHEVETLSTAGFFTFSKDVQSTIQVGEPSDKNFKPDSWKICVYLSNKLGLSNEGACVNVTPPSEKTEL